MLGVSIVLCLLVGGSLSDSLQECRQFESRNCDIPRDGLRYAETYEAFCSQAKRALRCMLDADGRCNVEERVQEWSRKNIDYVETEVCNRDTQSYRIMSNNLQCFQENLDSTNEKCNNENTETRNPVKNAIRDSLLQDTNIEAAELMEKCLERMFTFYCHAVTFGVSCGREVGELHLNASVDMDYGFSTCPPEVRGQLPRVIDGLRSAVEAKALDGASQSSDNPRDLPFPPSRSGGGRHFLSSGGLVWALQYIKDFAFFGLT